MWKWWKASWRLSPVVILAALSGCGLVWGPSSLSVSGPQVLRAQATGDQVYTWDDATHSWETNDPSATFSGGGYTGAYFTGPAWRASDGSLVGGRKIAEYVPRDAAPWQLFQAVDHRGTGVLSTVTYIRCVNTVGGGMPTSPGTIDGQQVRMHFTATYEFYGPGATAHSPG